jgi:hypothetical protein
MDANVDVEMEDLSLLPIISPYISREEVMGLCENLSLRIPPEETNDEQSLNRLWSLVFGVLSQDKKLNPATKAEYLKNVQDYPKDKFVDEVREASRAKKKTAWAPVIKNSAYSILFREQYSNDFIYLL